MPKPQAVMSSSQTLPNEPVTSPDITSIFPLSKPDDIDRLRETVNRGLRTQPHLAVAAILAKPIAEGIYEGGKHLLETTRGALEGKTEAPSSTMMDVASIFPLSGLMGIGGKLALAANAPES